MQLLLAVALSSSIFQAEVYPAPGSYLYQPSFCMDHLLRLPAVPYYPQPGDIFLATDHLFLAKISHRIGLTAAPQHSGVVVRRRDGRIALLEGGPFNSLHCRLLDLEPHLAEYTEKERVWIRQRKVPLTCEQSWRLTVFAEMVDGNCFAVGRLLRQATPLRARGPIRTHFLGKPHAAHFEPDGSRAGIRKSYYCSELVTEALVAAGVLDPETARPSATYPRDLFFGRSINCYLDKHLNLCDWYAPARWTLCPGTEHPLKVRPWLDGDGPGPVRWKK